MSAHRELEVAELTERHNRQLREMRRECEVERSRWGGNSPSEWIVGIDVSARMRSHQSISLMWYLFDP